jgi:putative endonuclease
MGETARSIGAEAERRAAAHLVQRGLVMVARNYRCRGGEIDLVMRDGPVLVFVEVRARAASRFGGAAESITARKQARIILAARHYLARHGLDVPCRFDALLLDEDRMDWIKSAFDA